MSKEYLQSNYFLSLFRRELKEELDRLGVDMSLIATVDIRVTMISRSSSDVI